MGAVRRVPFAVRCAISAVLLIAATEAHAQVRQVEILNSDFWEVTSDSLTGTILRLTGNVRLRQDTTRLRSRSAVYYETRGEVVLTGDVRVISGADTLTAAVVTYDSNTKTSRATGNVRVGDGESVLFAPQTTYDSRAEVSAFEGGGRILHQDAVITAPTGTYSSARRFARLDGPVRLVDSTGVLTAARGTYDARIRRADFAGDVRLVRPDARLWADSVVYFRRTERARAYRDVVLERIGDGATDAERPVAPADSSRRTFLFGDRLLFDGQDETASARGPEDGEPRDPLLLVLQADSTGRVDTTLTRAPRLDAARLVAGADTSEVITAAGGARLWERRLGAVADSARFVRGPALEAAPPRPEADTLAIRPPPGAGPDSLATEVGADTLAAPRPPPRVDAVPEADAPPGMDAPPDSLAAGPVVPEAALPVPEGATDRLGLHGAARPSVWADGAQITGDRLFAFARDEAVDELHVLGAAFAARLDSTLGRLQQIAGRQMVARFDGDDLRTLSVFPNAQALYFEATPEGLLDSATEVSADSIAFVFRDGEIRELDGDRGIQSTLYSGRIAPEGRRLPGFAFDVGGAPTREALLGDGWEAAWLAENGPSVLDLLPPGAPRPDASPEADPDASPVAPPDPEAVSDADAPRR
ncbi:MAG: OstA-like protein [Bacteroidota bacterium]